MPARSERIQLFDTASKFLIGVAGLALSAILGFATLEFNRAANKRQVYAQIEATRLQRDNTSAQVAASLSSAIVKGSDDERELALMILASIAPEQAQHLAAVMASSRTSVRFGERSNRIVRTASVVKRNYEYTEHIRNAQAHRDFSLFP